MSNRKLEAVVIAAVKQPLSALSNHSDVDGLERHLFCSDLLHESAPVHVAIHTFDGTYRNRTPGRFTYTESHAHNVWEVDLIIPQGRGFAFQLETNGKIQFIRSTSTIIIPAGVMHRMEVIRGRGVMVCIVCSPSYAKSILKATKPKRQAAPRKPSLARSRFKQAG